MDRSSRLTERFREPCVSASTCQTGPSGVPFENCIWTVDPLADPTIVSLLGVTESAAMTWRKARDAKRKVIPLRR